MLCIYVLTFFFWSGPVPAYGIEMIFSSKHCSSDLTLFKYKVNQDKPSSLGIYMGQMTEGYRNKYT